MKRRTTFMEKLAAMILIMAMVMPQSTMAQTSYIYGFNINEGVDLDGEIAADDTITIMMDYDEDDYPSYLAVIDRNWSSEDITTILSNAQSTVISATTDDGSVEGGTSPVTNSLTVGGDTTTLSAWDEVGAELIDVMTVTYATTTVNNSLVTNGIDNSSGGITNAGAISGITTLTGGINSSTLTLADAQATLGVGTASSAEITVLDATNIAGVTSVTIGAAGANQMIVDATSSRLVSANGTQSIAVNDSGTAIAGPLSVTGLSTLSGGITADNIHISDTTSGENNISGVGTLGVTTLNVSGLSTLSGGISADNFTVADTTGNLTASGATNIIGTAGSSVNTIRGATNTITGATTITSTTTANQMIVDATSSRFVSANGFSSAAVSNSAVSLVADSDGSSANARSRLAMTPTAASLLVNTSSGASHGISIDQTSTVISGGTDSTTLTLDDDGATFADEDTGAPVTVTGVADGVADYDAVNMRQYNKLEDRVDDAYSGIASVAALAAIPSPVQGKNFSLGLGYGNFKSESAVAVGGKAIVGKEGNTTLTAGVGFCGSTTTVSAGIGWSF